MSLLLKNVLIIDRQSPHHNKTKNILIKKGLIESFTDSSAKRVIDCSGKAISPGFFDLNAHFNDPGHEFKEDIESGSKSARLGGFTDVNLIPQTDPVIETKSDVEYVLSKSQDEVDIHVSAAVSEGTNGENLTEMLDLLKNGAGSFSDGDKPIWNTELLIKALQYTSAEGIPIFQNARDVHVASKSQMHEGYFSTNLGLKGEPSLSEILIIQRDLDILRYSGGRIHFSKISTKEAVKLIAEAKREGLSVTCDVAIHHLLFSDSDIGEFDTNFKTLPPYRSDSDRKALIAGIKNGTIDAICSNHRPQDIESKQLEFDLAEAGSIALQTFLPSLLKVKGVPFELLVEKVTKGPRQVLGLENIAIEKGGKAKLTLMDLEENWVYNQENNSSKSKNSPFLGENLKGKILGTINGDSISIN